MKKIKAIAGLLTAFVVLPIWYYLLYKLLQAANASELMWFLYWIYLPINLLAVLILKMVED